MEGRECEIGRRKLERMEGVIKEKIDRRGR